MGTVAKINRSKVKINYVAVTEHEVTKLHLFLKQIPKKGNPM